MILYCKVKRGDIEEDQDDNGDAGWFYRKISLNCWKRQE